MVVIFSMILGAKRVLADDGVASTPFSGTIQPAEISRASSRVSIWGAFWERTTFPVPLVEPDVVR